jgi:ATP-dependent DNA helicase PIF1
LIVTGDFFQLPPVKASGFAFEAQTWPSVMKKTVVLNHVFRQKDQGKSVQCAISIITSCTSLVFIDVLNEMRIGQLSAQALELFKSLDRPLPESKIEPAEL